MLYIVALFLVCSIPYASQAQNGGEIPSPQFPPPCEVYEAAWKRLLAEWETKVEYDDKRCFAGIESVEVVVMVVEDATDVLSEQTARDKFELMLRKHGVPLSKEDSSSFCSDLCLILSVSAGWDEKERFFFYILTASLHEPLVFYRNEKPHKRLVQLWEDVSYGVAGRKVARRVFIESIEEKAEQVANLYLSANQP